MRVCVDLTSLADNFSGIERFALSITKELIKNKNIYWILLFKNSLHKEFAEQFENVEKIIIKGNNKLIFNQIILPIRLKKIKADSFFFPAFPAPFFFFNKNSFNTIHDLSCWDCPKSNKKYMLWYFKVMYWKASLGNKKIITVSEFSKKRICEILNVKPENIAVIYNGISDKFNDKKVSEATKKIIKKKYNLPDTYVLCLSTLEPRKNLKILLRTYLNLYKQGYVEEIVLAGRKGWKMEDFLKEFEPDFLLHVHFTGFIEDDDLPDVYKMAKIFVFPSMYEGFGIPPLEAIFCGTPVISSDAASMPEILGEKAVYFKSNDCKDLEKRIIEFNTNKIKKTTNLDNCIYKWNLQAKRLCEFIIGK